MKRTPLYDEHVRAGARVVEFAGWQMPVQYSSIIEEHRRVRTAAGLFDVSHMGEIEITGPGAEACCARVFANDARRLAPGRAQYSLIPNDEGGVVDDVIVYRLAVERFLVCVNASNKDKDLEWVRAHATGGCRIDDRSDDYALLSVQGPHAGAVVGRIAPVALTLRRFGVSEIQFGGSPALVARTGYTGEDGFELFLPSDAAVTAWRLLLEARTDEHILPVGLGARDTLRLEAALPLYGHEIDDSVSPYEVGLDWVVKLDRPDMVGFVPLAEASRAPARRSLIGLQMLDGIARQGCPVLACGVEIGKVTSGSYCPFVEKAVALALVERVPSEAAVEVEIRGKPKSARVTDVPFYVSAGAR